MQEVLGKITQRPTDESEERALSAIARDVPEPVIMDSLARVQDARLNWMAGRVGKPDSYSLFLSLTRLWERTHQCKTSG
jgi:hypothetical protein